jgi:hypothetical protein
MYPVERSTYMEGSNPGALTGNLTGTSTVDPFTVSASGMWSVMNGSTSFTTPNEPFITVVTADINLNVANSSTGPVVPTEDHMNAEYWSDSLKGAIPPGLPAGDTVDQTGLTTATLNTEYLGVALPTGYNDNVGYSNQTAGYAPPGGGGSSGGGSSGSGYNLAAVSLKAKNTSDQSIDNGNWSGSGTSCQGTLTFTFKSTFNEGGTATVRFFTPQGGANGVISEIGGAGGDITTHINTNIAGSAPLLDLPRGFCRPAESFYF